MGAPRRRPAQEAQSLRPPEPEALAQALGAMRSAISVTPLLVFDQFDVYQARHREKFLPRQRKSWLPARQLREMNAFWRAVAELSDRQAAHVLVVTRSDTAAGLRSVEFQEPETHWLDRLETAVVAPVLAQLAGTGVAAAIRAPERGWDRLRQRLARDLERDGFVLPQQLRSALAGLRGLPYLTVADYEKAGGLAGLEARLVEREVKRGARERLAGGGGARPASRDGRSWGGVENRATSTRRARRRCGHPEGRGRRRAHSA